MKLRLITCAAITAVLTAGIAVTSPAQATPDPLEYVALGDSYSAGSGILPLDPTITPLCARSTRNYPNLVATATGAVFRDVTCGGAETSHFSVAQYPGTIPQFDALSSSTDLVTLSIGGNDQGLFAGSILNCMQLGLTTLGFGSPCKDKHEATTNQQIDTLIGPAVAAALEGIRARAPHAKVAIVGYPWIMPATGGCYHKMPIARGDVAYLRALQDRLNNAIKAAAQVSGAQYVDLSELSDGHDSCQPIGVRWVEPALLGLNFVPVHPNALGEQKMAEAVLDELNLS